MKWAEACDSLLIYYEKELTNKQVTIGILEENNKRWKLVAYNQEKQIENRNKLINVKDKKILGLKFKMGIAIPVGVGIGVLIGKALQ